MHAAGRSPLLVALQALVVGASAASAAESRGGRRAEVTSSEIGGQLTRNNLLLLIFAESGRLISEISRDAISHFAFRAYDVIRHFDISTLHGEIENNRLLE